MKAATVTTSILLFFVSFSSMRACCQATIAPAPDTVRVIEILRGNSLREKRINDSISIQTIAGSVIMKEGLTLFNCDSAAVNKHTNIMEAFGNIHINQQDSIHTYAQYLKYIGQERIAYLKKDVRLTDKKGIIYTQEMEYDLKTNIARYKNGGRVVNGKTTLTSQDAVYYADTKDVYFKKDVHLIDPKYDIRTDSLLYNTQSQVVTFITYTHVKSKDGGDVYTSSGNYDLKNGKAFFAGRTVFKDSSRTYISNNSAIDETSGIAQLEGDAVIRDSVNGTTVTGGQIFLNNKTNSFLATRKPVLVFKGEKDDSTFIAADTLFSGIEKRDSTGKVEFIKTDTLKSDSVIHTEEKVITAPDSSPATIYFTDTLQKEKKNLKSITDSSKRSLRIVRDSSLKMDTTILAEHDPLTEYQPDSIAEEPHPDTALKASDTGSVRYFKAFHHVRIYNDSLQAVCDSLFYSSADSVFRLFQEPVVFSNKSQIAGDTINLYTKNRKAERVRVFNNGMLINEASAQLYNQIGGRTMNGYFKEGMLDYMRVRGSPAESIYYPQDDDSAFTGMNRSSGDLIDVYFINRAVNKVKFVNDVNGIFYPLSQVPDDQKQLAKFKWLDSRRPKNKLELFE